MKTGSDGYHPPIEEYLKTIYELEEEGIPAIRARLAERLRHSPPTITEMVARLIEDGYIESNQKELRMTAEGHAQAESVVRRHRLAECLLVDIIGIDWPKAHQEADRWEHVISDEVEPHLIKLLNNPQTCPHGNPIPGSNFMSIELHPLVSSQPGEHIKLRRIAECVETDFETLSYLDGHSFKPGVAATVSNRAPDGTLTLEVGTDVFSIGTKLATNLYVETI